MNKYFLNGFKGKNRWWRYLVMIIAVFVAIQIGSIPFNIVAEVKALSNGLELKTENLTNFKLLGIDPNLGLFLMTLGFTTGIVAFFLLTKPLHARTVTDCLTGRKKFDVKRFLFGAAIWGGLMIISFLISYSMNPEIYTLQFDLTQFVILVIISVIFITLQASFEEVIFRGYLQQGLAVLTKNAWVPLIITALLFGLMHILNPEVKEYGVAVMLPQYILMGMVLSVCVIMDEGLEIAIGVHVINNIFSALIVTHNSSVLQTPAIFKVESINPEYAIYELLIFSTIFIAIMTYKYKWGSFKKIFAKITPEVTE